MQKVERRLAAILRRAKQAGLSAEAIAEMITKETREATQQSQPEGESHEYLKKTYLGISKWRRNLGPVMLIIFTLMAIVGRRYFQGILSQDSECLVEMPFDEAKVFREPEDCSMCRGVSQVERVTNISQSEFDGLTSRATPVIVTDGTKDWSAPDVFTFDFFRALYKRHEAGRTACQFFPYNTEFASLREALNMSAARARLEPGTKPWYIGWSNCNDAAGEQLRRHYKRPYFLPLSSENMALSWIFMGGPGEGAHMHVDNVHYASWQAQLRGRKKWRLAPPPECCYACAEFAVVVEPGEILVVDTNRWYHQTHILPGDISITIGTEFD